MRANRQDWFDKSLQAQAGLSSKKLINLRAKKHRNNPTPAETRMIDALHAMGEKPILSQVPVRYMIIDIVIPGRNLLIEVDGSAHNGREMRDKERDRILRAYGYNVARITNDKTYNKEHIASLISQYPRSEQAKMEYVKAKIRARKNALIKSIYYSSE